MLDIINVLECFAPVFSARVWQNALILLIGAILCRKERTVAAILRVMGLGNDPHFTNYHRVLSKARWSGFQAAKILLGLLVALVPVNWPVIIGVDDTIERRKGKKIKDKGCYRDPVRSTQKHVIHSCIQLGKVTLISRLRLDARLFDFPGPEVPGKRGPKPQKGKRLTKLKDLVDDPDQDWQEAHVKWYGGVTNLTGVCLWHTPGQKPVLIRWVLVVDPHGKCDPEAFFSTDTQPIQIVEYFVLRWGVEVTFQESRRHLGVETQRQWTDKAVARSTPALMGLFPIVCLMALRLISAGKDLVAWYQKKDVTFSDVLAFVRRYIWASKYVKSTHDTGYVLFPVQKWEAILDILATAA
jgi:hypothetical protein